MEIPSILENCDILGLFGITIDVNANIDELKLNLRRNFLRKAKECHPDKQQHSTANKDDLNEQFSRLKAAFDFVQEGDNLNKIVKKAVDKLKADLIRKERSNRLASQQATYLDKLIQREQAATSSQTAQESNFQAFKVHYKDVHNHFTPQTAKSDKLGELLVAAKSIEIANGSELNLLLLGTHFPQLFDNYGLLQVDIFDLVHVSDGIYRVGRILFTSHEQAIKALLYYRNSRHKFRCDLYALALGNGEANAQVKRTKTLEEIEDNVFAKMRARFSS